MHILDESVVIPGFRCFNFQEQVFPFLRSEAAKRLTREGLSQSRIADHLGVSQAMVSRYLRMRARPPVGAVPEALRAMVDRTVGSVLEMESKGRIPPWCPLCPEVGGASSAEIGIEECLRGGSPVERDDAQQVLANLRAAAARVERGSFAALAPEVYINLAMSARDARDRRRVAALPGRMVEVRGRVRAVSEPEFGASGHLSDLLLRVQETHPELRAVMCVKDSREVRAAARSAGLSTHVLARREGSLVARVPARVDFDLLVDPGDFGVEPITYVFATTAVEAVEKAERLLPRLLPRSGT